MIRTRKSSPNPDSKVTPRDATAARPAEPKQTTNVAAPNVEPHQLSAMKSRPVGKYQVMPPLSDDDRHHLRESIRKHGVRVPVEVDENDDVLDGYHRLEICQELGIECPSVKIDNLGDDRAKREYARGINLARRHLTSEQKRQLISEQLADTPDRSNRQVAQALGVSHHTVGEVRGKLEATGQIAQFAKTVGRDEKARPIRSVAPKRRRLTDIMLTELNHLAAHCRDIAPDKFLPGLASQTRRQEALGSMRIVSDWIEAILPHEPGQERSRPPRQSTA